MSSPAIQCRDLSVRYGSDRARRSSHRPPVAAGAQARRSPASQALDAVSLDVEPGSWCCLLGPNGSGKSTMVLVLAGQVVPTAGSATIFGRPPTDPTIARQRGVVFQSVSLDPLLTVRQNLGLFAACAGLGRREAARRIADLAQSVAVADRLDDRVGLLSGGLARRVDLARALLGEPALLLLDEATVGLDPAARAQFFAAVRAGCAPSCTVLFSTHLLDEAEHADHCVLMHEGRPVAEGPPGALRRALGPTVLRVRAAEPAQVEAIGRVLHGLQPGPSEPGAGGVWVLPWTDGAHGQPQPTIARLVAAGAEITIGPPTLEDLFLARTSGAPADASGDARPGPGPSTRAQRTLR